MVYDARCMATLRAFAHPLSFFKERTCAAQRLVPIRVQMEYIVSASRKHHDSRQSWETLATSLNSAHVSS